MSSKLPAIALALAALWAALRAFERANLYAPEKTLSVLPASFGIPYEDVFFRTKDRVRLHGWSTAPRGSSPRTVVIFHGNAGNISGRVEKLRLFRAMGLGVLLFDYRGYGRSEGRPSEEGTYLDAEAVLDGLAARGLGPDRLVYYGESLGAAVALEAALRRPPAALILDSGFTSTAAMAKLLFPWLPARPLVRHRYDSLSKIGRLRAPLLVVHSRQDDIVPFAMGRALFSAAPEPKEFLETRGDHNEGFRESPEFADGITDFLRRP